MINNVRNVYLQIIFTKCFFVVGTLAGGARAACLREDQQQKTAGLYIFMYPSPAVVGGDGPAYTYVIVGSFAVTNISRKFFSRLRDSIGLVRPSRMYSMSGCCSRPRGAVNACINFDLFSATSAVKVVINKIPLSTDFTVVLSKSCLLGRRLKGLSRWQLV